MIVETLFGLSLALNVSLGSHDVALPDRSTWLQMSVPQRDGALLPLVYRATDCILRKVQADPRYRSDLRAGELNDLIADSIEACRGPVRAMVKAHDRMYGAGSGEAFLLGPYLDVLPAAVAQQVRAKR